MTQFERQSDQKLFQHARLLLLLRLYIGCRLYNTMHVLDCVNTTICVSLVCVLLPIFPHGRI
jgi:hypothetical protein